MKKAILIGFALVIASSEVTHAASTAAAKLPAGYVTTQTLGTKKVTIANSDGSFNDTSSRLDGGGTLIWSKNDATFSGHKGQGRFFDAIPACNAMNSDNVLGYKSGWRSPSIYELSALHNAGTSALNAAHWVLDYTMSSSRGPSGVYFMVNLKSGKEILNDYGNHYLTCVH